MQLRSGASGRRPAHLSAQSSPMNDAAQSQIEHLDGSKESGPVTGIAFIVLAWMAITAASILLLGLDGSLHVSVSGPAVTLSVLIGLVLVFLVSRAVQRPDHRLLWGGMLLGAGVWSAAEAIAGVVASVSFHVTRYNEGLRTALIYRSLIEAVGAASLVVGSAMLLRLSQRRAARRHT